MFPWPHELSSCVIMMLPIVWDCMTSHVQRLRDAAPHGILICLLLNSHNKVAVCSMAGATGNHMRAPRLDVFVSVFTSDNLWEYACNTLLLLWAIP